MNNSAILTTTFCRKCKKLRSCLESNTVSNHKFLCKKCADNDGVLSNCVLCGREGIAKELNKHGGFCHLCEKENTMNCKQCGKEIYVSNRTDDMCNECFSGINVACRRCGDYVNKNKLANDKLCEKCNITVFKKKTRQKADEVMECFQCGREQHINNMENGLCVFCCKDVEIKRLKNEVQNIKKKRYRYR